MEKILQRIYLTDCNLLILKDLRRAHKIKWKCGLDDKKNETCKIGYKYCDCFLEYVTFKDIFIEYKCL